MSNGKGDQMRPLAVSADEYERRWRATFQRTPMTNAPLVDVGGMRTADGQRVPDGTLGQVIHEVGGRVPLDEVGTMPRLASHEPDPSGGRKVGE